MPHALLSGLRVIEVASGLGAAYCGKLLADAGAEVICVEPPGGSTLRRLGPFVHDEPGIERGLPYIYVGANKQSVTLDLHTRDGHDLFLRLLAGADVLIDDLPPGEFAALGIDDDAVGAARPGLVWTSLTNFGLSGPYRDLPASSLTLQALCGWLNVSGERDREPVQTGGRLAELAPGLLAAVATLGELLDLEPDSGPRPRRADVSAFELMTALHPPFELGVSYGNNPIRRNGNRLASTHPFSIVPCAEGGGFVGALHLTHAQWELICSLMGITELLDDPELQTGAMRLAHADRIDEAMQPWLESRTAEQAFHEAQQWRIPFAAVYDMAQISASPQLAARHWFREIVHPQAGHHTAPGPAIDSIEPRSDDGAPDRAAPALGQDNAAVYGALGLQPAQRAALRKAGAI